VTSCPDLAGTGFPVASILVAATTLLAVGAVLVLASRAGHSHSANAVVLLVLGGAMAAILTGWSAARAAPAECGSGAAPRITASVMISQMSVIRGLAPGVPPAPISGVVANHALHDAYVEAITVSISSVTKAAAAAAGRCSADDYELLDATMPVGDLLAPGASANFAGASIAFRNTSVNQDACKSATVSLQYVASS
jgi:hypothetical protein